jgi:hypothetical protein
MKLLTALLVIVWWICIWGLSDLLTENWSREEKFVGYSVGAVLVAATTFLFPGLAIF